MKGTRRIVSITWRHRRTSTGPALQCQAFPPRWSSVPFPSLSFCTSEYGKWASLSPTESKREPGKASSSRPTSAYHQLNVSTNWQQLTMTAKRSVSNSGGESGNGGKIHNNQSEWVCLSHYRIINPLTASLTNWSLKMKERVGLVCHERYSLC